MIRLFDADNETVIGEITEDQLDWLRENLVEESLDEYSWDINASSINALEQSGADAGLVAMLRRGLGSRTSMELRHEPE